MVLIHLNMCDKLLNITVCHQALSIVQTGHNILREAANMGTNTSSTEDFTAITTMGAAHHITYKEVVTIMLKEATTCGLAYTRSDRSTNDHWYGVANPLFTICSAFKMCMDEIRLGVGKMPVSKRGDTTNYVDVSRYGIRPAHHILLEGATYKPERRAPMAQSLGPLTAPLCAYKTSTIQNV